MAGAPRTSMAAASAAANGLIEAPLFLEMQIRGPDHFAEFNDVAVDRTHKFLGRTAAGINRQILQLCRHAGIADRLAQALFKHGDDRCGSRRRDTPPRPCSACPAVPPSATRRSRRAL